MSKFNAVDLFSGTGSATKYFRKSDDWNVLGIDISPDRSEDIEADVLDIKPSMFVKDVDFIWASPPCKSFSVASIGHHFNKHNDRLRLPKSTKAVKGIRMVYHSLYLIESLNPNYWFLENPRGGLRKVIGEPQLSSREKFRNNNPVSEAVDRNLDGTVTYCQFGDDRMKPTDLWGDHPESFDYPFCGNGMDCHDSATRGSTTGTQGRNPGSDRWRVPDGLAKSVFESVNRGLQYE